MNTATILAIALLLDAVFGEPGWLWRRLPHPAVLMGRLVDLLDRSLNTGAAKRIKGVCALCILIILAGGLGLVLSLFGPWVETLIAAILIAQKSLVDHVRAVADGLRLSLAQGQRAVSMIVSRDTKGMTPSDAARAAIESAAENLSDGVVAPAFWFLIAGLPGVLIYKIVNTADSMIGYRTLRHADFGWASARMDDLLNVIPARLTALLIALPNGGITRWSAIRTDARRHKSPNAGWPEAAMARAVGVALAGPRTYDGVTQPFDWVNAAGRKTLLPSDIDATLRQMWIAWGLMLGLVCAIGLVFG